MAFAAVLVLWAAMAGVVFLTGTLRADLWNDLLGNGPFGAVLAGLVLAGVAGSIAALAAGVPGRERVVRAGALVALAGVAGAIGTCLAAIASTGVEYGGTLADHGLCFRNAAYFSLLPAAGLMAFMLRGWVGQPGRAAVVALAGAAGLGALVVHLSCPLSGPQHLLLGHAGVPVVLALLGALPLGLLLRRLAR